MSDLLNQASLVMIPSGYKEDVVYSEIPLDGSGDLQLTRASNGTRVNSAGLVEVVAWNLLTYSNDFSSSWALIEASKSTGVTDPIGNSNAIKLKYTTATSGHYITQGITLAGSNAHSVYAKAGELQFLQIASAQSIDEYANFNLSTGAVGTYGSYASNVQIENVGNGWYRCSVVFTNGTNGIYLAIVQSASSDWFGVSTYAGANSTNGLYLYGGQVNAGTLKPYFPTTDRLNVPRLTYQNGGGGCPSLLLEKQSTNYAQYSEDFSNGFWTKDTMTTVTANDGISPDGTQNADRFESPSSIKGIYSYGVSGSETISVYIKAGNSANVGKSAVLFTTTATQDFILTNDWQRISVSGSASSLWALYPSATNSFTNVLIWGAQAESGSYPTSYIPTTSSSATRVADACYKTGISSLIGQTEGTVFYDGYLGNETSEIYAFLQQTLGDAITSSMYLQYTGGQITWLGWNSSTTQQWAIGGGGYTLGQRIKIAGAYKANDIVLYVNGTQIGTDTNATIPTCTALQLGNYPALPSDAVYRISKPINQVALFKTRLTNAELASLTTI